MGKLHDEFVSTIDNTERRNLLSAILEAIREACPELTEVIKWNAPSFCYNRKDRLTIMLHKREEVGLIFHTGAKPKEDKKAPPIFEDTIGLLRWNSNIRANVSFSNYDVFMQSKTLFIRTIQEWIEQTKNI